MGGAHVALLWCSVSQRYISIGRFPASKYSAHKAVLHIKEARMMSSWGLTCSWKCSTDISQPSHKGTVYSVDHMTRRVLLWFFSSWALRDFSKSSCFFRRASTLSKESPKSSFSRNAWRKNRKFATSWTAHSSTVQKQKQSLAKHRQEISYGN